MQVFFIAKNYTCNQKPGAGGLIDPPVGWSCKMHAGLEI